MFSCLSDYFRCPKEYLNFGLTGSLSASTGYFQFGNETVCYGRYSGRKPTFDPPGNELNACCDVQLRDGTVYLPFDPSEVIDNLRLEAYAADWREKFPMSALARTYYFFRPLLPVDIRKHLQEFYFRGWRNMTFPLWPVDCSVDNLLSQLLSLSLKTSRVKRIPFIWFWPDGATSCAIMTHDVETQLGCNFCNTLMDIDDSFGIKSSFQVIPEQRYTVNHKLLDSIRDRGFEIVVHDLNHDGHLYRNRKQFLERAAKINAYRIAYSAQGFRAASLYRKQLWYDALNFAYDMSIPNVAHLDPQRGGCCTVMPYFIGSILELPVTMTQDYTLFNILGDCSMTLWEHQAQIIGAKNGLMSFIIHPDYIVEPGHRKVYEGLVSWLCSLREDNGVWISMPGEVNRWWRQRAEMQLVPDGQDWRINGAGSERACLAYAVLDGDQLRYEVDTVTAGHRITH